jgi:hypothetical protein
LLGCRKFNRLSALEGVPEYTTTSNGIYLLDNSTRTQNDAA